MAQRAKGAFFVCRVAFFAQTLPQNGKDIKKTKILKVAYQKNLFHNINRCDIIYLNIYNYAKAETAIDKGAAADAAARKKEIMIMKTKKFLSLMLAVLMLASAIPMTFIPTTAAVATPETPATGTLVNTGAEPTQIPVGDSYSYYTSHDMFTNNSRFWTKSILGELWLSANSTADNQTYLNHKDTQGIMFKVDASAVPAGTSTLQMTFSLCLTGGQGYLCSNIGGARAYGNAEVPTGASSTWYTLTPEDNGVWQKVTQTNTTRYFDTKCSYRGEFYVYIPFDAMYTRLDEDLMLTGVAPANVDGKAVSTGKDMLTYSQLKKVFNDQAKDIPAPTNIAVFFNNSTMNEAAVSNFSYVTLSNSAPATPEQSTDLPVVGQTTTVPFVTKDAGRPLQSETTEKQGYFADTTEAAFKAAKGMMFEIDTTTMTTADPIAMSFFVSAKHSKGGNDANNYLFALSGMVTDYANSSSKDMVSTWYYSEDGVNWRALTANYTTNFMLLPAKHTHMYIYIPMDSFYSRFTQKYIEDGTLGTPPKRDANNQDIPDSWTGLWKTDEACVNGETMQDILAADFIFDHIHAKWASYSHTSDDVTKVVSFPSNETAQITNWQFVMEDSVEKNLPDGTPYTTDVLHGKDFNLASVYQANSSNHWNFLADNATSAGAEAVKDGGKGIMFKVDSRNATVVSNNLSFSFALQIVSNTDAPEAKSNSTYIVSTPHMAYSLNSTGTQCTTDMSSTWYYSTDGQSWSSVTAGGGQSNNVVLTLGKGISYVYIPLEDFWFKHGLTYLQTGTEAAEKEPIVSWTDGKQYLSDDWYFYGFGYWFNDNNTLASDPNVKITDWRVVTAADFGLKKHNLSLTDTIAYQITANNGSATNANVSFMLGDKVYWPESIGEGKYSFENLLPQQATEPITVTWSGIVNDELRVQKKTVSVYDYLVQLKNSTNPEHAKWRELAQASINYAAAAQYYRGYQDIPAEQVNPIAGVCNDLAAAESDLARTETGKAIFKSANLVLEGKIQLRIKVADTVNTVTYEIAGGASGEADVVQKSGDCGYVYISLNSHELDNIITVTNKADESAELKVSANWYLWTKGNTEDNNNSTAMQRLMDAIAAYGQASENIRKQNQA